MADVDVHDLARETLATQPFPAARSEAFRVLFADKVHAGTWQHASQNTSHEICGVLVGTWARDADGPYALVSEYIRCDNATQKFAEVTFTHESWAQINSEMDTKYQELRIIGWYHSHPNFGIFLSDRDCFIQEHFFSGAGQVAFVIDPVRKIEGLFEWRKGKPTPMHHYWVGDKILLGEAPPPPTGKSSGHAMPVEGQAPPNNTEAALNSPIMTLLLSVLMLLIGLLYGGYRSSWEQARLVEGAVAHYGLWKNYKPGFEEYLSEVIMAQGVVASEMNKLAADHIKLAGESKDDVQQRWRQLNNGLDQTIKQLKYILDQYGLSDGERLALLRYAIEKQRELSARELPETKEEQPAPEKKSAKNEKPTTPNKPAAPSKPKDDKPETTAKKKAS